MEALGIGAEPTDDLVSIDLLAHPTQLHHLSDRRLVHLAQDRDHLLFRQPAILHDFLSSLEAVFSSFNWSENHLAGPSFPPRSSALRVITALRAVKGE